MNTKLKNAMPATSHNTFSVYYIIKLKTDELINNNENITELDLYVLCIVM